MQTKCFIQVRRPSCSREIQLFASQATVCMSDRGNTEQPRHSPIPISSFAVAHVQPENMTKARMSNKLDNGSKSDADLPLPST